MTGRSETYLDTPVFVLLNGFLDAVSKDFEHGNKVIVRNGRRLQTAAHWSQIGQNLKGPRDWNRVIAARHHIDQSWQDLAKHNGGMLIGYVGTELSQCPQRTVDCIWVTVVQCLEETWDQLWPCFGPVPSGDICKGSGENASDWSGRNR